VGLLLLVFSINACGVRVNTEKEIFRYINVHRAYGTIYLGTQKSDLEHLMEKRDGGYYLRNDVFGMAQEIALVFNVKKELEKFVFTYASSWNRRSEIADYTEDLGTPIIKGDSIIWNDGKTQFRIYTEGGVHYAELSDL